MKLRPIALALGLACLPTGCAEYSAIRRFEANERVDGYVNASWQQILPLTWLPGPPPVLANGDEKDRGSLYIDFQKRQARGQGVSFVPEAEIAWKITGLRVVTMRQDRTKISKVTTPKLVVFDGDFRVKTKDGQVFHSTVAYDRKGPGSPFKGAETTNRLRLLVAPAGVTLRDGIEVDGMVPLGELSFHQTPQVRNAP